VKIKILGKIEGPNVKFNLIWRKKNFNKFTQIKERYW